MSTFFTWETLLTVSGAAAATAYIVQFLKHFSAINKINSQLIAFIVALIIMFTATYFNGTLTLESVAMLPISAIIVCFAANGAYDSVAKSVSAVTTSVESIVSEFTTSITSALNTVKKAIESIGSTATSDTVATTDTATSNTDSSAEATTTTTDEVTTSTDSSAQTAAQTESGAVASDTTGAA